MCQERLTSLGMLAVEGPLARTIDYNSIIELFASRKARKVWLQFSLHVVVPQNYIVIENLRSFIKDSALTAAK